MTSVVEYAVAWRRWYLARGLPAPPPGLAIRAARGFDRSHPFWLRTVAHAVEWTAIERARREPLP